MNEVVKYNNTLNTLQFKNFSAMDYNVLMSLCHKMRDQGDKELVFTFNELKKLTEFGNHSDKLFAEELDQMIDKLIKVNATVITGDEKSKFILFPTFKTNAVKGTLKISVNSEFAYILNELTDNFTRFELKEFAELDGKYAKTLYRILKQYKYNGWWKPTVEELRCVLDVPANYDNKKINAKILAPAVKILSEKFKDLKCEPIKAQKRGAPVERYYFSFQAEKQIRGQKTIADYPGVLPGEEAPKKKKKKKNTFNNFQKNSYDFKQLEEKLLEN